MTDEVLNQKYELDLLCKTFPSPLVNAIELCSLPLSLDDKLGYDLIHKFGKFNGTSRAIWAEIKRQPFVYPYENGEWRFIDFARNYFISRLEQQNGTLLRLHGFLKEYFEEKLNESKPGDSPQKRELVLRVNYHLVPSDPEDAIKNLNDICENAARANRVADIKGVTDLFKKQDRWLSSFNVEGNYFEGRYAYIKNDYKKADICFRFVWNHGKPDLIKSIAGHLLGVIWASNNDYSSLISSEKILRDTLDLGIQINEDHNQAQVMNSLGGVLIKLGGHERLETAENYYRDSLKLLQRLGDRHGEAMVLNSLGGVLIRLGGHERLEEAETYYRDSLKLEQQLGNRPGEAMVLNSLGGVLVKLGGRERLEEAETYYRNSLKLERQFSNHHGEAMVLNSLGGVLVRLGDRERLEEAETYYQDSLKLVQQLGDRHGQAMIMTSLGGVLVKLGGRERLERAEIYYRDSLKLEQQLGNRRGEAMVLNSLGSVLVRLGDRERLEAAEMYYLDSLKLFQHLGDNLGQAMIMTSLGGVQVRIGGNDRLKKAEIYYRDSLKLQQQLDNRRGEAMVLNGLINLFEIKGDFQTACQLLEKVITIEEILGETYFIDLYRKKLEELQLRIKNTTPYTE